MRYFFMNLFDKGSDRWLKIYRIITIVLFWLFVGAGFIGGCVLFFKLHYSGFLFRLSAFNVILAAGCAAGLAEVWVNMLIIQYLDTVQAIYENLLLIGKKTKSE